MAVGKVGGKKGAATVRGAGIAKKVAGPAFQAKVEQVESVAPSISLGEVGAVIGSGDPMVVRAAEIARQFRDGAIKTKEEATRRLVSNILREIVHTHSKMLTDKIAQDIEGDPRLRETLERMWAKEE